MKSERGPVVIRILEKEYRVACPPEEQDELFASARMVDQRMREIRDGGKVIGTDRIAVMAALNLAHDLLRHQRNLDDSAQNISHRIRALQEKIEGALRSGNQLEV